MSPSKRCIRCDKIKYLPQFYKNPHMVDGYVNVCISCKLKAEYKRINAPFDIAKLMHQWARNTVRAKPAAVEQFFSRRSI